MAPITKICRVSGEEFVITDREQEFCKKIGVPLPTLCPLERARRRLAWRNDRKLYSRKCDYSGKPIISLYTSEAKMPIYEKDIWWSDVWNPLDYGRDYDFSRPFFEQFMDLYNVCPRANSTIISSENSDYSSFVAWNKNCYLCSTGNYLEDGFYAYNANSSRDICDALCVYHCELCYECTECYHCYNCNFALHSKGCTDCWFIDACENCQNCAFCTNLRRKKYHFFNQPLSKEEYEVKLREMQLDTPGGLERARKLWLEEKAKHPKRESQNLMAEDCVGEYIIKSKNCVECHSMTDDCEDCMHIVYGFPRLKDSQHCCNCGEDVELCYECICSGDRTVNTIGCDTVVCGCENVFYSTAVVGCSDCFGCTSLRNKRYCILNKQYTKEEYEALLPRIIEHMKSTGEWGEFFPMEFSPFAYNETSAHAYFPLTRAEVESRGLKWRETQQAQRVENSQLKACPECGDQFRVIAQESAFYAKKGLPEPEICYNCRHLRRLQLRNPVHFWDRNCDKCSKEIRTTYSPKRPDPVYCEACYLNEVY